MILSLAAFIVLGRGIVLLMDDGRGVAPNDYSAVGQRVTIKELVRFEAPQRIKLSRVLAQFDGEPGQVQLHLWKDIDSRIPFRHFEFDAAPPIRRQLSVPDLRKWVAFDLSAKELFLEKGQRLYVGVFVAAGPRLACDAKLDHPQGSTVEIYDPNRPGKDQSSLRSPAGDFLLRLEGRAVPEAANCRFKPVFRVNGNANALAWADVDGDGYEDLLINGFQILKNLKGRGFRALPPLPKADFGVFADFDGDGDQDLFQGTSDRMRPDRILRNDGHGRFTEMPSALPKEKFYGRSACWLDYDQDGRLDLFVANGAVFGDLVTSDPSRLYRNVGARFEAKRSELAVDGKALFASSITAGDLDGDGRPELFVGTYRLEPDQLWAFSGDVPANLAPRLGLDRMDSPSGKPGGGHCLGSAMADFDNDGDLDLIVTNLMHPDWRGYLGSNESLCFENLGQKRFKRRSLREMGVDFEETPANPVLADFDNDGRLDLFHHSMYHRANLYLWRHGKWVDRTASSGISASSALAAAACDFDHDGSVDLAVADKAKGLIVYRNVSRLQNWVAIRLRGTNCNRAAGGAVVRLRVGNQLLTRQVTLGRGMACQDAEVLHFGLGEFKGKLVGQVFWPCGTNQAFGPLPFNQTTHVSERGAPH